jgi:hypothetical protein
MCTRVSLHALLLGCCYYFYMLDGLLSWTAHSEHHEVCAGPSWSSYALQVRSLLLHGFRLNPLFDISCETICFTITGPQGRARGKVVAHVLTALNNEPNSFLRDWPGTGHLALS